MKATDINSLNVRHLGQRQKHLIYYFSVPENRKNISDHKDKLSPTQKKLLKEYLDIDL